jgi:hypothetical protein
MIWSGYIFGVMINPLVKHMLKDGIIVLYKWYDLAVVRSRTKPNCLEKWMFPVPSVGDLRIRSHVPHGLSVHHSYMIADIRTVMVPAMWSVECLWGPLGGGWRREV